uniref:Uncharacterized protein n=1 Tax=Populus alba TaxID=43335 RepID=A0A4U5NAU5_POPAL|nr:hypothetical protein D5086_0000270280 [Populus alba]
MVTTPLPRTNAALPFHSDFWPSSLLTGHYHRSPSRRSLSRPGRHRHPLTQATTVPQQHPSATVSFSTTEDTASNPPASSTVVSTAAASSLAAPTDPAHSLQQRHPPICHSSA